MKRIIFLLSLPFFLTSCYPEQGTSIVKLKGDESALPQDLKGLKIYKVFTEGNEYVRVGVIKNQVVSTQESVFKGKVWENIDVVMVNSPKQIYKVKSVLMENDSLIVFRK